LYRIRSSPRSTNWRVIAVLMRPDPPMMSVFMSLSLSFDIL